MTKRGITYTFDEDVIELIQRETARRSAASGTKVSESATVNAVLREALTPRTQTAQLPQANVAEPMATTRFNNPMARTNPKPGSK